MRSLAMIFVAASLALASCSPTVLTTPVVVAPVEIPAPQAATPAGDSVIISATQALIVANNAYQGANAVARVAVASRQLDGAQLDRLAALDKRILFLLEKGEKGQSLASRAAEVLNLVPQMRALIGR